MSRAPIRLHVLFESLDRRTPYGASYIRLLRPLGHPTVRERIALTSGPDLPDEPVDMVVIDRLWRDDLTPAIQADLFDRLRKRRLPYVHALDDNLLDLGTVPGEPAYPNPMQRNLVREFIRNAAGVIVSTPAIAGRIARMNDRIVMLPNQLDETLYGEVPPRRPDGKVTVFGYMGTFTHLGDLLSIIGPLRELLRTRQGAVRLELVGIAGAGELKGLFDGLPVVVRHVPGSAARYPEFVGWMKDELHWDAGIAPLRDTHFNRHKSDIKFLDYGMLGIPGVFSAVDSYRATVRDGIDGLLAANTTAHWTVGLRRMVDEPDLRRRMAVAVRDRVWSERTLRQHAGRWADAIGDLLTGDANPFIAVPVAFAAPAPRGPAWTAEPASTAASAASTAPPMSRRDKLLNGVDLDGLGLEIGPSFAPILPKSAGHRIETLDHATREELVDKYSSSGVDTSKIEPVDHVWHGEPLDEVIGARERYDYILASHVIEHTPDLVAFLQQCETLLKPGGVLSLAVPDQRYCFDLLRPLSTTGEVLQAHVERRKRHAPGIVFDHFSTLAYLDGQPSWRAGSGGRLAFGHTEAEARAMFDRAVSSDEYLDVHNWRFTPATMALILYDLAAMGLTGLRSCSRLEPEGMEFYVQLGKGAAGVDAKASRLELALAARREWADSLGRLTSAPR